MFLSSDAQAHRRPTDLPICQWEYCEMQQAISSLLPKLKQETPVVQSSRSLQKMCFLF